MNKKHTSVILIKIDHDKPLPEKMMKALEHKAFDLMTPTGEQANVASKLIQHDGKVVSVKLETVVGDLA